jgi:hypothetical protein
MWTHVQLMEYSVAGSMWHTQLFSNGISLYVTICANDSPDMSNGVVTSCSNWYTFTFIITQWFPPCFELPVPLVGAWLGHAFLLVDTSHSYCPCLSLAHFNTKFDICSFKLWQFAMRQWTGTCGLLTLIYSYCIIFLDHHKHRSHICVCVCVTERERDIPHLSVSTGSILLVL